MVVMAALVVVILIVMMVVMVFVLLPERLHLGTQSVFLHGLADLTAVQLAPGRGDQAGLRVQGLQQGHCLKQLLFARCVRAAQDDQIGRTHLIFKELAEVACVHFRLSRIHDGHFRADLRLIDALNRRGHIRELADAGRLDQNAVRGILVDDLLQGLGKVTHQRAADAARVHLGDLNARILQEAAVDGDVAELVFNQNQLFPPIGLLDQFADQGRFPCAEKAGKNVNLCHTCLRCIFRRRDSYFQMRNYITF